MLYIYTTHLATHWWVHLTSPPLQVSTQSSSTVATEEDHSIKGGRLMGSAVKSLLKHRGGKGWGHGETTRWAKRGGKIMENLM